MSKTKTKTTAKKPAAQKASKPKASKSAKAKPARLPKISAKSRKQAATASADPMTLLGNNHKSRKLDALTKGQKEKLLYLRDAMVDSMAGVAKDNLRSRAE